MHHTSAGDLLRAQAADGTLPPALAEKHVRQQQLMDGAAITAVLESSGVLRREEGRVVVLDGFPRNMDQLLAFAARVSTCFYVFSLEAHALSGEDRLWYLSRCVNLQCRRTFVLTLDVDG